MVNFLNREQSNPELRKLHKIQFVLLLIAICVAPFYLFIKYKFSGGLIWFISWSFPGLIAVILFGVYIGKIAISGRKIKRNSKINLWMKIILFYYFWLCFFAVLMGASFGSMCSRFWQNVVGVLIYFLMLNYLNIKNIRIVTNVFCILSFLIALLFLAEWLNVTILGNPSSSFSVSRLMYDKELLRAYYVSNGGVSVDVFETYKRIGGILGTYRCTSLFISLGCGFLFYKMVFYGINAKRLAGFFICFIAIIACNSRFVTFSFVFSIFITYSFFVYEQKYKRMTRLIIVFGVLFGFLLVFVGEALRNIFTRWYYWSIVGDEFSPNKISNHIEVFTRPLKPFFEAIQNNPLLAMNGTGFGDWSQLYSTNHSGRFLIQSGDLGWLSVHYNVGFIGLFFIVCCLYWIFKLTYLIMRDKYVDNFLKSVCISSLCFVLTSVLSVFHAGSLFHIGNYFSFFVVIAIIAFTDGIRRKNHQLNVSTTL